MCFIFFFVFKSMCDLKNYWVGKNVKVRFPDGDTDYFGIVAHLLQRDALDPYLFIICLDYMLRTSIDIMKDNKFQVGKEKKQKIPCTNNYKYRLC